MKEYKHHTMKSAMEFPDDDCNKFIQRVWDL